MLENRERVRYVVFKLWDTIKYIDKLTLSTSNYKTGTDHDVEIER